MPLARRDKFRTGESLRKTLDGLGQFEQGIRKRLVTHGYVGKGLVMISGAGSIPCRDPWSAEVLVVLKDRSRESLRCVVRFKAVAGEQSRFDVVKLIVVLAPVSCAVQPIAWMAVKIGHPGQFERLKIV